VVDNDNRRTRRHEAIFGTGGVLEFAFDGRDGIRPQGHVPEGQGGASLPRVSSKTNPEDEATAAWMFDIVLQLQPEHKRPNFAEWAKHIRLLRERDGRTDADIRAMFSAADADEFWQANIRCPAKLRKQWDQLDLKFRKSSGTGHSNGKSEDWIAVLSAIDRYPTGSPSDIEGRQTLLGPERFEAMKRIGSGRIRESNDFEKNQTLRLMFYANMKDIRDGIKTRN